MRSWCDVDDPVGNADPHHEVVSRKPLPPLPADCTDAIALGVNAPPLEVNAGPVRNHAGAAVARKFTDFVKGFPGILCELESLAALRLSLFRFERLRSYFLVVGDG